MLKELVPPLILPGDYFLIYLNIICIYIYHAIYIIVYKKIYVHIFAVREFRIFILDKQI